ncbi:LysR family transcriptional regulator [Parachlamydia sp. AcF125]|uniref:LysR family transcriptional regulator n=1 Tax=Parachlamydia sp. AcF125 TaxID=2795736 RepID=UPI001BCA0D90|nr:LysR family transcriptional regulator [Parachlamydia sp. AcF125]MBS4168738.1 HTH-type transcriptional regulator DmlR [Parachlamydia sp. AcF125]
MSKFDQILYFMTIVETNSFAKAARKLGVSTAAVSKQLHLLEKHLGVELLHRTTRRLELSESGKLYFQHCKKIMHEIEEADKLISTIHAEPRGHLSVISGRHFAQRYILPFLQEFIRAFPHICLNLELAERIPDLYEEKIDLVIGYSIPGPESVVQRKIATTSYVLCASPQYLQAHKIPQKPSDLTEHVFITHSMRQPNDRLSFADGSEIHLKPMLKLNDSYALAQCALAGLGIIKVHHYIVADELEKGLLVEVLANYKESETPLYLYYQESRHVQPKIRHFIDFVLNHLSKARKIGSIPMI